MLPVILAALAVTGGNAVVTAMVTDGWESIRSLLAHLFGRQDAKETESALGRLDQSRSELAGLSGADLEKARQEQEIIWRTRLSDLLERDPGAEDELRGLVTEIQAQTIGSAGRVDQRVVGFDQAKQAVQGHGVQNNTFGD